MKRKTKVFVSLMFFSISLMVISFSVYATSNMSFDSNGDITLVVSEPLGKIYLDSVFEGKLINGNGVNSSIVEDLYYDTSNSLVVSGEYGVSAEDASAEKNISNLDFDYKFTEEIVSYKYTFKVSTKNIEKIAIRVTTGKEVEKSQNIGEKVLLEKDVITNEDDETTVTYFIFLRNITKNANMIKYSVKIELNFPDGIFVGGWENAKIY